MSQTFKIEHLSKKKNLDVVFEFAKQFFWD